MSNSINNIVEDMKKNFNIILGDCYINNNKQVKDHRHELFLYSLLDYTNFSRNTKGTEINTTLVENYFSSTPYNPDNHWEDTIFSDPVTPPNTINSDTQFIQYDTRLEDSTRVLPSPLVPLTIHYELYIYLNTLVGSLQVRYPTPSSVIPPLIQTSISNILSNLNELNKNINSMGPSTNKDNCIDLKSNIETLLKSLFFLPGPTPSSFVQLDFTSTTYNTYINNLKSRLSEFIFTCSVSIDYPSLPPRKYINMPAMFIFLVESMNLVWQNPGGFINNIHIYQGNSNFFISFLDAIYNQQGNVMFTRNTVLYSQRKGLKSVLQTNKNKAADILNKIEAYYNSFLRDDKEYYRKPNNPNILYTKNPFNNNNEVDVDDPDFNNDRTRNSAKTTCYGSIGPDGINDSTKCGIYINKCINGTDINECKQFMTNNAFWSPANNNLDSAINGVKTMSPTEAMNVLNKLAFKKVKKSSNSNSDIIEYESIDSWLSTLKTSIGFSTFTDTEYKDIEKNNNLKFYLKLLIDKINNNPSILNKDYKMTKSTIIPFYDTMKNKIAGIKHIYFPTSTIQKTFFDIFKETNRKFIPLPAFGAMTGGTMNTGMDENNDKIIEYLKSLKISDDYFKGSQLKMIYEDIQGNLARHGHTIQPDDDNKIKELIERIKSNELTLMATIITLLDYSNYVSRQGKISYPATNINLNEVIDLISEYNKKGKSFEFKTNTLMGVLQTISSALNDIKNK
jgi:hypothetical protein